MIRKAIIIFCENEHGFGEATFPDLKNENDASIVDLFINPPSVSTLRKNAKLAGWGRVYGADYCPSCMESM